MLFLFRLLARVFLNVIVIVFLMFRYCLVVEKHTDFDLWLNRMTVEEASDWVIMNFVIFLFFWFVFYIPRVLKENLLKTVICKGSTFQAEIKFEHGILECYNKCIVRGSDGSSIVKTSPGFKCGENWFKVGRLLPHSCCHWWLFIERGLCSYGFYL